MIVSSNQECFKRGLDVEARYMQDIAEGQRENRSTVEDKEEMQS